MDYAPRRHLPLSVLICIFCTLYGSASAGGCKVRVQSYVIYTEPSYYAVAGEPTVTPVQKFYRGLIDLNVQLTGDEQLEVWGLLEPICDSVSSPVQSLQRVSAYFFNLKFPNQVLLCFSEALKRTPGLARQKPISTRGGLVV